MDDPDKLSALRRHFGHNAFRPGQEPVIDALLSGRDVLGVMPTGAGKSICYQLPALLLGGLALVISPLISLMKDQVSALSQAGISAAFLNSSLTPAQCRLVLRRAAAGDYVLLYVAPERLSAGDFLDFARSAPLSLVAVDEAHCVSQWGQDFRPSYLAVASFLSALPRRPAVGAFTATATARVKEDVARLLELRDPLVLTTGFDRPNLSFSVESPKSKLPWLRRFLARRPERSGIVYCATRRAVETVWGALGECGVSAARYHAGLEDEERRRNQEDFVYDRARIMVATNAFGMGIDKSNVAFVVHYNMPKDLESYYQEAGRAGRDGAPAECVLLFSRGDVQTARYLLQNAGEAGALSPEERAAALSRDLERLEQMLGYCRTEGCLRAYLLSYFGERAPQDCGNCGNCLSPQVRRDITTEAQKILSAVARVERQLPHGLGPALIAQLLCGSRDQRLLRLGLDRLPTYGALRGADRRTVRGEIDALVSQGFLQLAPGEYPVLRLAPAAREVLFQGRRVTVSVRRAPEADAADRPGREPAAPEDGGLLSALKALRTRLARQSNVPAYLVLTNASLSDLAAKRPHTESELLEVSGVGAVKAQRYGADLLSAIAAYEAESEGTAP